MRDDHVQVKIECIKQVDPFENSRAVTHLSPHHSGTVIDSEQVQLTRIRKSTMRFPASHQPKSCATPNFPEMGTDAKICRFSQKFRPTTNNCYTVSLSKNFQRRGCSAINCLSNRINILARNDPVPETFGPKGTDPNTKDARFMFHTRRDVQSASKKVTFLSAVRSCKVQTSINRRQ